jgi:hypothetical protein
MSWQDLSGCGSENLKVRKCLTELYSANSEWWEPRRFLKRLLFFLTGVLKAQIVRTRRIRTHPGAVLRVGARGRPGPRFNRGH